MTWIQLQKIGNLQNRLIQSRTQERNDSRNYVARQQLQKIEYMLRVQLKNTECKVDAGREDE
jgi:hypothetical protein